MRSNRNVGGNIVKSSGTWTVVRGTSPADGTILARNVNPGQVVAAGHELLTVADLGTVWVIGDLYEKDFAAVRVGTPATIAVPAAAGTTLRGRAAYIDPRVEPATRTAKVRGGAESRGRIALWHVRADDLPSRAP